MKQVDLTVGITAHNEGVIAHKTMLSVFEALKNVEKAGYSYEIMVHVDNGDNETIEYFERYRKDKNIKIVHNKFGDLGKSRNFLAQGALGDFVSFLDADDLISDNWFVNALDMLKKTDEIIVVHPEVSLTFGDGGHTLWIQHGDTNRNIEILCGANRWISVCMAKKNVFLDTPYPVAKNGYGNEDWWFNTETVAKGIKHTVAKNAVQFYRRKKGSLLLSNNDKKLTQWYSELFDIKKCQALFKDRSTELDSILRKKRKAYLIYKKIRNSKANVFITPIARPIKRVLDAVQNLKRPANDRADNIPEFVIDSWKKITEIEPQLYPTKQAINSIERYYSDEDFVVGEAYLKAIKKVKKMPNYVFIVPWLVAGGADKVVLNYIKALSELHPDWSFAIITTLPSKNTWEDKLPENAYIVDFGNNSELLNEYERDILFSRILTQLKCKKIHLINSEYGYRWVADHKELIAKNYNLNVSVFCHDYVPETNNEAVFDYMDPFLVSIYDVVDNIFTDNKAVIDKGVLKCGFDRKKFKVHYQPIEDEISSVERKREDKLRVLWAGRVAYQKCPEVLCEIARKLDNKKFQIDVFGRLDGYSKKIFDGISSLTYRGSYNGFSSLETEKYDLYLYTSNIDGIPNCLLEAAAAGLPIIAPNVGGIGEFIIDKKTGTLIDKYDNINAFTEAIVYAKNHPEEMQKMAKNAQGLLQKQHSWSGFVEQIKSDII